MTPQFQRFHHADGDCFRTALACLLNVACDEVPHLIAEPDWLQLTNVWLARRGKALLYFEAGQLRLWTSTFAQACVDTFHLMTVTTAAGYDHCIVARNGEPFWCPTLGDVRGVDYPEVHQVAFLVNTSLYASSPVETGI